MFYSNVSFQFDNNAKNWYFVRRKKSTSPPMRLMRKKEKQRETQKDDDNDDDDYDACCKRWSGHGRTARVSLRYGCVIAKRVFGADYQF